MINEILLVIFIFLGLFVLTVCISATIIMRVAIGRRAIKQAPMIWGMVISGLFFQALGTIFSLISLVPLTIVIIRQER